MSTEARTPPERAGAREWTALAVLGVPAVLVMMNMSVLYLALPTLSRDLDPSGPQLLWITDIYGFMVAGALITMGTLGDRIGHRRILLIGAVAFTAASVFAAYANSAGMLVAARAVQGVAAASLAPSSLSVIRNLFRDPAQRTLAITIWMMSFMGGGALGPLVGGVLLQYFWWGSVFLVAVPTMLVLVLTVPFLVPEFRSSGTGRLDLVSVAMSLVTPLAIDVRDQGASRRTAPGSPRWASSCSAWSSARPSYGANGGSPHPCSTCRPSSASRPSPSRPEA
ncbi:Putative multidrug resistance protein MdtD [Streptomyces tanashiensis]